MTMTEGSRAAKLSLLTAQERECLRLVGLQLSSKEIAQQLGISKASVDTYCNRARAKLGVTNRREAAQLVRNLEAASPPPIAAAPGKPPPPSAVPPPAPAVLLPSIASLGPLERCGVIIGAAAALMVAFGMLLSGLQSLNDVIGTAHAHDAHAEVLQPRH